MDVDITCFKSLLEGVGQIVVHTAEQMVTALDDGDFFSNAIVIVSHFKGNGTSSQDDDRIRRILAIEDVIAGQVSGFFKALDDRNKNL